MRRTIISLMLLCMTMGIYAQRYNGGQEKLRTEISSYLRKQGFNPEAQDDGLKFKSEGSTYYIEIDKEETKPMYVRLRRYVKYDGKLTRKSISGNLNHYNTKYGVKAFCQEKSVVLSAETYVTQASEFNYVFPTLLSQIKSAYSLFTD